ncbi:MAG: hypothetical protein C0412_17520, partial [Flavobacterium sp.]|nr:hypothetical protein [Flavobacterium sp.]
NNCVFLCSNKKIHARGIQFSELLKIKCLHTPHRKPNRKIINYVGNANNYKGITVIGDKFLTDGLFAKNIKGEFIKVKRIVSNKERLFVKVINRIDDAIYSLLKHIW